MVGRIGNNGRIMRVDNEFTVVARKLAIDNNTSIKQATRDIAEAIKGMKGKTQTRKIIREIRF